MSNNQDREGNPSVFDCDQLLFSLWPTVVLVMKEDAKLTQVAQELEIPSFPRS